jgi:hypothetical protein
MKKLLLYFFLSSLVSWAQDGYLPGYVIKLNGDTVKGKVRDRKFINGTGSWQKIDFVDSENGKYGYDAEEIREYGRRGRTKYRSLNIGVESKATFVEVQEEGAVVLYAYNRGTWGGAGNAVLVQTSGKGPKEHVEFFLEKNGQRASLMQWRPRDYKSTAKIFFSGEPDLIKQIEDEKLIETDIRLIVQKFNGTAQ